jgi:hypothetical protein
MHVETSKGKLFPLFSIAVLLFFRRFIYVEKRRNSSFPLHVVIPSMPMHILLYNKIGTRNIVTEYSLNIEICAYKKERGGYASEGQLWL